MISRLKTWLASARLKSWRWPELPVLVAVAGLAACGWLFVELADLVVSGETHHFDDWAIESLRDPDDPRLPRGPRWLADGARDITALGSTVVLTVIVTIASGFLLLAGRPWLVALLLAAVLSGSAVNLVLKSSFDRPRPPAGSALQGTRTSSFPSGHSLSAALVYLTLGAMLARAVPNHRLRVYLIGVALVLTLLVGLSRVYLGVHYPTDVLAGWSVGAAWALLWWLIARTLARSAAPASE